MDDGTRARIEAAIGRARVLLGVSAVLCLGGPVAFGITQLFNPKNNSFGAKLGVVVLTILMMGIFVWIPWIFRGRLVRLRSDLHGGYLIMLNDYVRRRASDRAGHRVEIGSTWFRVSRARFKQLAQDRPVLVRYTPAEKMILTIAAADGSAL